MSHFANVHSSPTAMITQPQLHNILAVIKESGTTLLELVCTLVLSLAEFPELTILVRAHREAFCHQDSLNKLFSVLVSTPDTQRTFLALARNITVHHYLEEMGSLLPFSAGFHFNASHAPAAQFDQFSSVKLAKTFHDQCPSLWRLFGLLLNAVATAQLSKKAIQRGDYLSEITYCDGQDIPPARRAKANTASQATSTDAAEMPDDNWGAESDVDDSSDDEPLAAETEATAASAIESAADIPTPDETVARSNTPMMSGESGGRRYDAKRGAPWRKGWGDAFDRQVQRTMVVSDNAHLHDIVILTSSSRNEIRYLVYA